MEKRNWKRIVVGAGFTLLMLSLIVLVGTVGAMTPLWAEKAQASSLADPRLLDSLPRYEIVCGDANPCVKYDEITGNAWVLVNRPGGWTWIAVGEASD